MASSQIRLASAYEQYRQGRYDVASTHLQGLRHPKAAHLLGMIALKQNRVEEAHAHLEWACIQAPKDAEIVETRARAYQQQGQNEAAERCYRRALDMSPNLAAAEEGLGRLLLDQQRFVESESVYSAALAARPNDTAGRYGRATALLELGQAEVAFTELNKIAPARPEVDFMLGRAALEMGDLQASVSFLQRSFQQAPDSNTLLTLAQVLWLSDDIMSFENLVTSASRTAGLGATAVTIARSSERLDWAWEIGLGVQADKEDAIAFRTAMAALAIDRNDPDSAIALTGKIVEAHPTYSPAIASLIAAQLMRANIKRADELIDRMRRAEPNGQHWIGYSIIAARQRGEDVSAWTTDLVRTYELPVPEGFESLAEFNAAFEVALTDLHQSRQRPLDQSLRGGTQTQRNLVGFSNSVVTSYLAALREPIAKHLEFLSSTASNPCSSRNQGAFALQDCWSVSLEGDGFHKSHVHPNGWLSSAYYVAVPESVGGRATAAAAAAAANDAGEKAGWLKFGEPPFALQSPQEALHWVQPKPGVLALFPSYLWHSTQPTITAGKRLTAPFDVVPA